jgi:hypothetical protein
VRFVNNVVELLITLVLAGGLVWAVAVWRSRGRTAALVAAACALQLAVRLIWLPAVRLLFGPLTWSSNLVQRFFIASGSILSQLSLAASLGLLVYAALDSANRKP